MVKFGILSTAKIGRKEVIPALQQSDRCEVVAIASRSAKQARNVAEQFNIVRNFGTYEELLEDRGIDAIYNPLPNHLHVPWTIKALQAGKHVLCEKPLGMSVDEVVDLVNAASKYPDLKVMEAFMYRFHPQWEMVKKRITAGEIGAVKSIHSHFSYFKTDPGNIRNKPETGGGGMLDIGCYCISATRFLYGQEPVRIFGRVEMDPDLQIDRLAHGLMHFKNGMASFTCGTQMQLSQRVTIYGTNGLIELEKPFNPPTSGKAVIKIETDDGSRYIETEPFNHYTRMADAFAESIMESKAVPLPLTDAVANMKAIRAIIKSSKAKEWIEL